MKTFYTILQLLVVVKVVVENFINLILELLLYIFLLSDSADSLSLLFLHTFTFQLHILDDEPEVLIDDREMLRLVLHLGLLLIQSLNVLLTRSNTRPELLNLVIEDEFEFLKLLRLLSILINLVLFIFNGTFALLQLVLHRLDVLFLTVGVSDFSVQVLVLLLYLLSKGFHLLLLMPVLILDESQLTLHLHTVVNVPGQVTFVLLLDFFDLVPSLVFDALTLLSVAFIHLFDLQRQGLLLSFLFFALKHLVTITVLHQALVRLVGLAHQFLKLLKIFLFLLEQAIKTFSVGRTLLFLILLLLLELVVVLVAMPLKLLAIGVACLAT